MENWSNVSQRLSNDSTKEIRLWNDLIKMELRTRAKVKKKSKVEQSIEFVFQHVLHVRFGQLNQSLTEKIEEFLEKFQKEKLMKTEFRFVETSFFSLFLKIVVGRIQHFELRLE